LENTMHRAVLLAEGPVIRAEAIELTPATPEAAAIAAPAAPQGAAAQPAATPEAKPVSALVGRRVDEVERDLILETLTHCLGNRTRAAEILGISIRTLRNKLHEYRAQGVAIGTDAPASQQLAAAS
jgi:two-component system response regulator FlrC